MMIQQPATAEFDLRQGHRVFDLRLNKLDVGLRVDVPCPVQTVEIEEPASVLVRLVIGECCGPPVLSVVDDLLELLHRQIGFVDFLEGSGQFGQDFVLLASNRRMALVTRSSFILDLLAANRRPSG